MDISEPISLSERGSILWQGLSKGVSDPARLALVTEAARIADRLDELDNIIQGKGVLNLMQFRILSQEMADEGTKNINVEVKFQSVLAEARQQATALGTILKTLGLDAAAVPAQEKPLTALDELNKRREAKKTG